MVCLRPLAIAGSRTSKFVCNSVPVTENAIFRSATDFADNLVVLKFIRQVLKFLKSGLASNSSCSASFSWYAVSLSTCSGSHRRTLELVVAVQYCENCWDGQASGHPLLQTNSAPPLQSRWYRQYTYLLHHGSRSRLIFFHLHALQLLRETTLLPSKFFTTTVRKWQRNNNC